MLPYTITLWPGTDGKLHWRNSPWVACVQGLQVGIVLRFGGSWIYLRGCVHIGKGYGRFRMICSTVLVAWMCWASSADMYLA